VGPAVDDGALADQRRRRYHGRKEELGEKIASMSSLDDLAVSVDKEALAPRPRSGHQEELEALVNSTL
jgi:xylose isomerase